MKRFWSLALLLAFACESKPEGNPAELQQHQQRIERFAALASQMIEHAAKPTAATGCNIDAPLGPALVVTSADLRAVAAKHGSDAGPAALLHSASMSRIAGQMRPKDTQAAVDVLYAIQKLKEQHPYLLMVQVTKHQASEVGDGGYTAGQLEGNAWLFAAADGKLVCTTEFSAASSERIASTTNRSQAEAVALDFEVAARRAIENSVRGVKVDFE